MYVSSVYLLGSANHTILLIVATPNVLMMWMTSWRMKMTRRTEGMMEEAAVGLEYQPKKA